STTAAAWVDAGGGSSDFYLLDTGGGEVHELNVVFDPMTHTLDASVGTSQTLPGSGAVAETITASSTTVFIVRANTLYRLNRNLGLVDTVDLGFAATQIAWAGGWLFASDGTGLSAVEDGQNTVEEVFPLLNVYGLTGSGDAVAFHNNNGSFRRITTQPSMPPAMWPASSCGFTSLLFSGDLSFSN